MSDNAERFSRETKVVRAYAAQATVLMLISSLTLLLLIVLQPQALGWVSGMAFLFSIVFAAMYQYFGIRFLVNLGTRYDLMPIVKRSLWFSAWANRPVVYYVCGMVAFTVAWLSLLWRAL